MTTNPGTDDFQKNQPHLWMLYKAAIWVCWRPDVNGRKLPYSLTRKILQGPVRDWGKVRGSIDLKPGFSWGVVLGSQEVVPYYRLAGIDLDSCRNPKTGEIASWALAIVEYFATYTEISPSGTGLHLLALYPSNAPEFQKALIYRAAGGNGKHPPSVEGYFRDRYFTVTEEIVGDEKPLREISLHDLEWLKSYIATIGWTSNQEQSQAHKGPPKKAFGGDRALLQAVLDAISPHDYFSNEEWKRVLYAVHFETGGSDEGLEVFLDWLASAIPPKKGAEYERENRRMWASARETGEVVTGATLLSWLPPEHDLRKKTLYFNFEDLIERSKKDPGAPFELDALAAARTLRKSNPAKFQRLRSKLKDLRIPVSAWDRALSSNKDQDEDDESVADLLTGYLDETELFHTEDGEVFADILIGGHRETHSVKSRAFSRFLIGKFYEETKFPPHREAVNMAIAVAEAKGIKGPPYTLYLRVGSHGDKTYLDMGDDKWRAIEIDDKGWRIIDTPPIRFRRISGMLPLPEPATGGKIDELYAFLNISSEGDRCVLVCWLLSAMRYCLTYPLLDLTGEQGSAKSTAALLLRNIIDPNKVKIGGFPRSEDDLFIAANNRHILAFDNISGMKNEMSDALCRVATGGGLSKRMLYTDTDEVQIFVSRPIIINGIDDAVSRPDLADRAVVITLSHIPEERRLPESEVFEKFKKAHPRILGALLGVFSHGLRLMPSMARPSVLPRMADFAHWSMACETAVWPSGTFMNAYASNIQNTVHTILSNDPVASAILRFMENKKGAWVGTTSLWLERLGILAGVARYDKYWPKNGVQLGRKLRRIVTPLRKVGILISFAREAAGNTVRISKVPEDGNGSTQAADDQELAEFTSLSCGRVRGVEVVEVVEVT